MTPSLAVSANVTLKYMYWHQIGGSTYTGVHLRTVNTCSGAQHKLTQFFASSIAPAADGGGWLATSTNNWLFEVIHTGSYYGWMRVFNTTFVLVMLNRQTGTTVMR